MWFGGFDTLLDETDAGYGGDDLASLMRMEGRRGEEGRGNIHGWSPQVGSGWIGSTM